MACTMPTTISASLDTVLRKVGNILELERRGDVDTAEIWNTTNTEIISEAILSYIYHCQLKYYLIFWYCSVTKKDKF